MQIDGSDHRWFENRADACTLIVFIDDPTTKLMQPRFVPSESTERYFQALRGYLENHGCPAFYSDKHSVFRAVSQSTKGAPSMTQFGRVLCELKSRSCAPTPARRKAESNERTERCRTGSRKNYGSPDQ